MGALSHNLLRQSAGGAFFGVGTPTADPRSVKMVGKLISLSTTTQGD